MQEFIRDVIYIRLNMFISYDIRFAILYGSIMLYIYKKIFFWNTHHTTNVQLCSQFIQTIILFDTSKVLVWTEYELL